MCYETKYQSQKENNYSVVKAYIADEIPRIPLAIVAHDAASWFSYWLPQQPINKNEFLTPTTKKCWNPLLSLLLLQVSHQLQEPKKKKRNLSFEEPTAETDLMIAEIELPSSLIIIADIDPAAVHPSQESPLKKKHNDAL